MKMKRNLRNWVAGALMLSCMSSDALWAEEKKTATREEQISTVGSIVLWALPYLTQEEEKAFNKLLKNAWERKMQAEVWNAKTKGKGSVASVRGV